MAKYTVAERQKFFKQVADLKDTPFNSEKAKVLSGVIAELASTEAGREELAQLITENLQEDMKPYDIRPLLFDTKTRQELEYVEYKRKGKFRAFRITRGGYVPKSQIFQDVVMAQPDEFAVRPSCHLDQIKTGRITSVAELREGAMDALITDYARYFYETMNAAFLNAEFSNNFATCTGGKLDKTMLDKILAKAMKYGQVSIVGTYNGLSGIMDFAGYTDTQKDEIMRTGKIGVYRGANIVRLDEFLDADGQDVIKDDMVFVVVRKAGHVDDFGELQNDEITDKEHNEFSIIIRKKWGFTLLYPEYLFALKITA